MLTVKNLVKTYRIGKSNKNLVTALDNVSIEFPDSGLVFLLGKSGSGKSTLLNSIGGLDSFDSGEIIIKGKSSKEFSQSDFDSYRNTFIGFIFQEYNILENFSVAKNIALSLELQGKKASKQRVNELLEQVDMLEYAKRKPNQLSGGQKQRVAIARALIKNPTIIMADEPTGALDSTTGKQVMETLKNLSKEKLVIVVTHDRDFAEMYGDRIIELKDGKIISDTTKKEVKAKKTSTGVSVVEGRYIHIKKGQELSNNDIIVIKNRLKSNLDKGDTIITFDSKSNDEVRKVEGIAENGNQNAFFQTKKEDLKTKEYNGEDLKLIKSKLKESDAFKMGASALKKKVGKLIFTIILSVFAFTAFGVIHAFASWDRGTSVNNGISMLQQSVIYTQKAKKTQWGSSYASVNESDVLALKEKFPTYSIKPVAGPGYNENDISIRKLDSTKIYDENNPMKSISSKSILTFTNDDITEFGFSLEGRLPVLDSEVCLSKHIYELLKEKESITTFEGLSIQFYYYSTKYILNVVGVVDDKTDFSRYDDLTQERFEKEPTLSWTIKREINSSLFNAIYVSSNLHKTLYTQPSDESYSAIVIKLKSDSSNARLISYLEEYHNDEKYPVQSSATVILDSMENAIPIVTKYIVWVAVALAIFAGMLLMSFISTSISYKKREIGMLRAIGARGVDVFKIFFNEAFIIAVINFVIATLLSFGACFLINWLMVKNLSVPITLLNFSVKQILLIFGVSVGSAFISCIIPVSRISRKKPIDAINNR